MNLLIISSGNYRKTKFFQNRSRLFHISAKKKISKFVQSYRISFNNNPSDHITILRCYEFPVV